MKQKRTLLALAVSALMFVLPTMAPAAPLVDAGDEKSFSGTFGLSALVTEAEPTITCEGESHVTGSFNAGGTGGTVSFDYTNCHIVVLGFTIPCNTTGAPVNNTIAMSNVPFDLVYTSAGSTKPGMLITNLNTTVRCGSTTPIILSGSVMGTITAPACGGSSSKWTFNFSATGSVQDHMQIGGVGAKFDLVAETQGSGTKRTSGLDATFTLTLPGAYTLTCP
jgi:hypothetical protein